jgi:hypothetical protein
MIPADIRPAVIDHPEALQQVMALRRGRRNAIRGHGHGHGHHIRQRRAQQRAGNLDGRLNEQRSSGGGKSVRGPLVLPELRCQRSATRRPAADQAHQAAPAYHQLLDLETAVMS